MKTPDAFDGEQLLSGAIDPDDAPQELKELAGLIRAARTPSQGASPSVDQAFVASIADEVRRSAQLEPALSPGYFHRIQRLPSGRVAAVATALMFTGGLAAAAATGSLPVSIQRAVSHGLAHVGISLPDPQVSHAQDATGVTTTTVARGPVGSKSTTGAVGLCEAYLHQSGANGLGRTKSTAAASERTRLSKIASIHNESVLAYCQGLTNHAGHTIPSTSVVPRTKISSHSPTVHQGSSASTKVQHSSNSHQGAHASPSPKTSTTTKAKQSKVNASTAGGSSTRRKISSAPSRSPKTVSSKAPTTSSSLPTDSVPVSNNSGKGVSAAQATR